MIDSTHIRARIYCDDRSRHGLAPLWGASIDEVTISNGRERAAPLAAVYGKDTRDALEVRVRSMYAGSDLRFA